jgi:hypothetical protein
LAVLNESDLFYTWMPSYKFPIRLGMKESHKLAEMGRGNQLIHVYGNLPLPLLDREVYLHVLAMDAIDSHNAIVVKAKSVGSGYTCKNDLSYRRTPNGSTKETNPLVNSFNSQDVPPTDDGTEIIAESVSRYGKLDHGATVVVPETASHVRRVDIDMGIIFQPCPVNHFLLSKSKTVYPPGEHLILLRLEQTIDAHIGGVPISVINFITRTVIGSIWGALLHVAEDVRAKKRPAHLNAITSQPELYRWIQRRVHVMLEQKVGTQN